MRLKSGRKTLEVYLWPHYDPEHMSMHNWTQNTPKLTSTCTHIDTQMQYIHMYQKYLHDTFLAIETPTDTCEGVCTKIQEDRKYR